MPNQFSSYKWASLLYLTRIHAPTGYLLSFFPAAFGLILAYEKAADLIYLPLFLIGSILVRSSGCIINDLFDQKLDKKVARTKNRPLANSDVSTTEALILLATLLCISFGILLSLNATAIYIGVISIFLITLYPLMKRITYYPQTFLGITFNLGCLIGYAAIKNTLSYDVLTLYIACGFWTMAYDTIYAFMDLKDDKKIGIKSTAILFEHKAFKLIITAFYAAFFILFMFSIRAIFSTYSLIAIVISSIITLWITINLDIYNNKNCMKRFKINNYIGFILFLAMLLEKL